MTQTANFVTIEELATHFALSLSTIRKWIASGAIPRKTYIKVGRTYRFKLAEVEAALLEKSMKAGANSAQMEFDFTGDDE